MGHLAGSSVKHPTSAQVMMSQFESSRLTSGSVLTAQSLEPAADSASPSLSAPSLLTLCFSKMNKHWGAWVAQSVKRPTSARSRSCRPRVRAPHQALG